MSIRLMSAVMGNRRKRIPGSRFKDTKRFVLLAIADNANDEGYCWPSIAEIAFKVGIAERSVKRIINDNLLPSGELFSHGRESNSNLYLVTLDLTQKEIEEALFQHFPGYDRKAAEEKSYMIIDLRDDAVPLGDDLESPGGDLESPKPSINHQPHEPTKGGDLESPLTEVLQGQIIHVDLDASGDEIPWEWEKKDPFFTGIARHLYGTPKNLEGDQRGYWMRLQHRAAEDFYFSQWCYWLADELDKPKVNDFISQALDDNLYGKWRSKVVDDVTMSLPPTPNVTKGARAIAQKKGDTASPYPEDGGDGNTIPNPLA